MGWRELSEDVQHWVFWVATALAMVGAVMAGFYWDWWAYMWNVPPPVRVLGVAAAVIFLMVAWAFLAIVLHHYVGWPQTHPFQMPPSVVRSVSAVGSQASPFRPMSRPEVKELAKEQTPKSPIPEGELSIKEHTRPDHLFFQVKNLRAEPKKGYAMYVSDLKLWSDVIEGSGAWGPWRGWLECHLKPIRLIESGNGQPGVIDFHDPKYFELLINPGPGPWHLRGTDKQMQTQVHLREGAWLFSLEFHWNGHVDRFSAYVRLISSKNTKSLEFLDGPGNKATR